MRKVTLAVLAIIGISLAAQAQTPDGANDVIERSLGSINQCYHGVNQPDPCSGNSYLISAKILYGQWKAVNKPWNIKFTSNGVFDIRSGTIVMSTIGPSKSGRYRIEHQDNEDYPTLFVDMDDGGKFKAFITMYGSELPLIDGGETTTFHQS